MSNFSFITSRFGELAAIMKLAEKMVYTDAAYSALQCRKALEESLRWMYAHDSELEMPYDKSLNSLLHADGFKRMMAPTYLKSLNTVRLLGNDAAHTNKKISAHDALHVVRLMHSFIRYVVDLYSEERSSSAPFDESLVPKESEAETTRKELKTLLDKYHAQQKELEKMHELEAEIKAIKAQNQQFVPAPVDPDEKHTRQMYIDSLLREVGWEPQAKQVSEFTIKNCMPQANGSFTDGRADYVLWGKDGLPLAVVEAKRTSRDANEGRHQAKLYADGLERMYKQRPVIFYTNGFELYLWDDLSYPPREVYGFYTQDELALLVQRRTSKQKLKDQKINNAITDRSYQHEAIRRVAEALENHQREALLIMATGSGKTRVAASLIDFLSKTKWVTRVLFLADRRELVNQAKGNLNVYLPEHPSVNLLKDKENKDSRIVFSTYQTIMGMIDGEKEGNSRYYGVGHFDMVIFDEIHRSVYNRYKHIFHYFDGIRIGLTATPKSEAHRDTYALFNLEPNNPTFSYELDEAVRDGYLVPPKAISVPLKFQRQGIAYTELSEEEKLKYEEEFADPLTGEYPEEIDSSALNDWLFNTDTVDKVLSHLMQHGIKVEGGDKLAKTIIFARSHRHSQFIFDRFNLQYPKYKGHFVGVIDYAVENKDKLLIDFKESDKMPQIAISVDMLDTGIDVPEVCNLVFFKPVRSSTKYWQMIGRGTRLCKELFGKGEENDKKEFVIFDFCQNFEFFRQHPDGYEATLIKALSQRLFELRLRLAVLLDRNEEVELNDYGHWLINVLYRQTCELVLESFIVRQHLQVVEKYQNEGAWQSISDLDMRELMEHIAPLVKETEEHESVKRFDALMLDLELSVLNGERRQESLVQKVRQTAEKLGKKTAIPQVAEKLELIREVQGQAFWQDANLIAIDRVRYELRNLLKFLDKEESEIYYTSFGDEFMGDAEEFPLVYQVNNLDAYRRKVEQYVIEHKNMLVIDKLHKNKSVTGDELNELERMLFEQGTLGTQAEFEKAYGKQPFGRFIRSIVGLDANSAKQAFSGIVSQLNMNAKQIRFMDMIINFFIVKGEVDPNMLFQSPFTDIDAGGIIKVFDMDTTTKIVAMIREVNANALVG